MKVWLIIWAFASQEAYGGGQVRPIGATVFQLQRMDSLQECEAVGKIINEALTATDWQQRAMEWPVLPRWRCVRVAKGER